jgi:NhaA family Na+:H+ antiporter
VVGTDGQRLFTHGGFTMSLLIAGEAFPDRADYAAAKIAIVLASMTAGGLAC